nr:flagellar protein FliT [Pseudomonas sp. R5(2019)]
MQRIEQTRDALLDALHARDWQAISELDLACRECVEKVLDEQPVNEQQLRENLEELLNVYRQLIEITSGERQAAADEMSHLNHAQKATKVYHLFR